MGYYDGTKILSLKDADGEEPELYLITTNRSAGKTTYFSRLLVNRFLRKGEKFLLLYRFRNELDSISDKFFKDIQGLFFNEYVMTDKNRAGGIFKELFLQKNTEEEPVSCGYAVALNSADQIKKYSHLFSDVGSMLFDEFQSESNHYCSNEIEKFLSVHTTVARGQGEMVRRVPVYLLSNTVSLLNPYYTALGITEKLRGNTHFLRGEGWVLEQGYNDEASKAQKSSKFNRAFSNEKYVGYASENVYLNDNLAFIDKPSGRSDYLCTLKMDGKYYAIREYIEDGIVYCDNTPDLTNKALITVNSEDHEINAVMVSKNEYILQMLLLYYKQGCLRFKNLECKNAVLKTLSLI